MEKDLTVEEALELSELKRGEKDTRKRLADLKTEEEVIQKEIGEKFELLNNIKHRLCEIEGHIDLGLEKQDFDSECSENYGLPFSVCGRCNEKVYKSPEETYVFCKK